MTGDKPHNAPASALEESAEELYEMAPCGYITTTVEGRIVRANRTLLEWLGYERDELIDGRTFASLLTVGGRIFFETHFNLLLRVQDAVDEIALDIVCKSGRILPTLINARQSRDAAGQPIANRFTIFNSTERRMYERQLLAARDLFQITLSSIGDAVIATDVEGNITFMNPIAAQLSGWPEDEGLGKTIDTVLKLVREDNGVSIENPIRQALRTGNVASLDSHTVLHSRDGREIPVDDSASAVRDGSGTTVGAVIVFRDISGRRRTEKALQAAHDELRRSNEDLSQFAHVASHDLRSPLNTVVQFSQLLERNYSTQLGDGIKLLGFVRQAATRMGKLIEDLLAYARVSDHDSNDAAAVDSNIQVETAIRNLRTSIEESGATVTHDVLPQVLIGETRLLQVFQNLIGNAIHYRHLAPPRIHIAAEERNEDWLFTVADNGMGIAPEYQAQIFEPFKRLHGADRPGSGIGLAVCKKIIERNHGSLWVDSRVDHGSTFFFTIPKVP